MLGLTFVLLQYMISAKAGLVNFVDGQANVHLHEQVMAGVPIETGPQGHAELLLTPGSFLRVGNSSKVTLDSVELNHVAVRLVDGTALVEVSEIDKDVPIRVTTGTLKTVIASRGVYRFSGNTASVIDGKLRIVGTHRSVKKGHQITSTGDDYVASAFVTAPNDDLDRWSANRSAALANANAMAYQDRSASTYSSVGYYPYGNIYSNRSSWIYSSLLGGFTFLPVRGYRSCYGYSFIPVSAFAALPAFTGRPFGVPSRSTASSASSRPAAPAGSTSRPRPVGGGVGGVHRPGGGFGGGFGSHGLGGRAGGHGGGHR
jgi:hypothetical protein